MIEAHPLGPRLITKASMMVSDVRLTTRVGPGPFVVAGALDGHAMVAERTSLGARAIDLKTDKATEIAFSHAEKLVGVTTHRTAMFKPRVSAVVTTTENALVVYGPEGERERILFHEEIARVVCSPRGPCAAVMMVDGTIEVVALEDGRRLLRIRTPAPEGELR